MKILLLLLLLIIMIIIMMIIMGDARVRVKEKLESCFFLKIYMEQIEIKVPEGASR